MANPFDQFDAPAQTTGANPYDTPDPRAPKPVEQGWGPYLLQKADDIVRSGANAITFGMADRLAGAATAATGVSGVNVAPGGDLSLQRSDASGYNQATDEEVKKTAEARERSPYATTIGDTAGMIATLPTMGGARLATGAASYGLRPWAARALGYGVEGGLMGAAQGAGNTYTGNVGDYVGNAAMGGVLGAPIGAVTGAAFGPRGPARVSSAETPISSELRGASDAQYRQLRTLQTQYDAAPIAQRAGDMRTLLLNDSFHPVNAPETYRALARLENPNVTFQTPGSLEAIRQELNKIPKTADSATDRTASNQVKNMIHDMLVNPQGVLPGTEREAARAGQIASDARANWAAAKRAELTGGILENTENRAGAVNSGLNRGANIRSAAASALNPLSPAAAAKLTGWNAAERGALRDIANPSTPQKILRYAGNLAGGGGGLAVPVVGAAAGQYFKDDPVLGAAAGVGVPVAGLALRMLSNRNAVAGMTNLDLAMRQRSPLYQSRAAAAPMTAAPGAVMPGRIRDAITYEILRRNMNQEQPDAP